MRKSYDFALSHDFLIYYKLGSYHFQNSRHSCFIFSIFFLRGQLFHIFHILPERSRSCPVNELPITMHVSLPMERFGNPSLQGNENPPRQTWGIWGGPAGGGILGMCFGYLGYREGGGLGDTRVWRFPVIAGASSLTKQLEPVGCQVPDTWYQVPGHRSHSGLANT